jgi:hypothetical protein
MSECLVVRSLRVDGINRNGATRKLREGKTIHLLEHQHFTKSKKSLCGFILKNGAIRGGDSEEVNCKRCLEILHPKLYG